ncbi:MAG: hypothetical protein MJK15_09625 [Colwellia sp.]|nr:hypothetical protein [Colwellia sp.]
MNSITDNEIITVVNKHIGFAIFLVVVPIIFILLISYFSGDNQLNSLLPLIAPISTVGACAHLIKDVLTELNTKLASNT